MSDWVGFCFLVFLLALVLVTAVGLIMELFCG